MRLSESLYGVRFAGQNGMPLGELNQLIGLPGVAKSCLPLRVFEDEKPSCTMWQSHLQFSREELRSDGAVLSGGSIYVDPDISAELKKKVEFCC